MNILLEKKIDGSSYSSHIELLYKSFVVRRLRTSIRQRPEEERRICLAATKNQEEESGGSKFLFLNPRLSQINVITY